MADAWKTKTAPTRQANLPLQDQINPAQVRQVDVKKNGNVIKTINVIFQWQISQSILTF